MTASRSASFEEEIVHEAEKWIKPQKPTPDWGAKAKASDHLWSRTSASGDLCYVPENSCAKHGPRLKCASCKIIVHAECVDFLLEKLQLFCRSTFQDIGNGLQREKTEVTHHWMDRPSWKGKCQKCSKSFQSKLSFGGKDKIAKICLWCKITYHNKESCFKSQDLENQTCSLGVHSNVIVPPTWIVKLPTAENETAKFAFAIKPIPSTVLKPLLIFINPKSGGNQGTKLLRSFQWLLNPRQIFDLTEGGPKMGLELFRKVPNLRILACGGDGTVGWILSTLDDLKVMPSPPIAVLPLGTGNDLARALGWGGGYTDEPLSKILTNVENGHITKLDRWSLKISANPHVDLNACEEGRSSLPLSVVNNYFSLGVDALIALEFHEAREAHPEKFNSRFWNKMFYGQAGGKDLIQRKWKDLCNFITLECDGKDVSYKLKDLKVHSILFLNIPCYGGGTLPWGNASGKHFQQPSTEDSMIEVIGLTTYQLPLLQAGGHGSPIAQCRRAKVVTSCTIPVQVDGEPCKLLPSVIEIELLNTVNMVSKSKHHGKVRKESQVEKITLQLKQLLITDYEAHHHHKQHLKSKATLLGSINVNFDTDLAEVRYKIISLLKEKMIQAESAEEQKPREEIDDTVEEDDENDCSEWWFLDSCTADKFHRVDKAQEQLYYVADICDGDLYILMWNAEKEKSDNKVDHNNVEPENEIIDKNSTSSSSSPCSHRSEDDRLESDITEETEQTKETDNRTDETEKDLMHAAMMGDVVAVARLHASGNSLTERDQEGRTALHHAAFIGNIEVVRYLVSYGPECLLDMQDSIMYQTALHRAAIRGDRIICSILVCAGASLDIIDKQGYLPQQLAELVGDAELATYLETMKIPVIV